MGEFSNNLSEQEIAIVRVCSFENNLVLTTMRKAKTKTSLEIIFPNFFNQDNGLSDETLTCLRDGKTVWRKVSNSR